jgi:Ras-related protein Rab-1A
MVVYDVTDRDSFKAINNWIQEIEKYAQEGVIKILVGNKSDLTSERQVSREEGEELAQKLNVSFIETSAKNADNIDESFLTISR